MKRNETLPDLQSGLYQGFVRHRRFRPQQHEFRYPLFMVFIRLSEITDLSNKLWFLGTRWWHWARFRRQDYLGNPSHSLSEAVRKQVADSTGRAQEELDGAVYFFGHLRYLGFYFSPLNLYFIEEQGRMRYMLAEVSNTPWNQRHYYVVDLDALQDHSKEFHVSPFNPMNQTYSWRIRPPGFRARKSMVHLEVSPDQADSPVFDATMVLKRQRLNQSNLSRVLIRTPAQTLGMVGGIYWQALKLFLKGTPIYRHPDKKPAELSAGVQPAENREQKT